MRQIKYRNFGRYILNDVNPLILVWKVKLLREHPCKTLAIFKGGGVKILQNLPTDSSKKMPKGEGG